VELIFWYVKIECLAKDNYCYNMDIEIQPAAELVLFEDIYDEKKD
jgi:hypothetical protein